METNVHAVLKLSCLQMDKLKLTNLKHQFFKKQDKTEQDLKLFKKIKLTFYLKKQRFEYLLFKD